MNDEKNFEDYVQAHERMWSGTGYPKRPELNAILNSPVVAFWIDNHIPNRHVITLHDDLQPIEGYLQSLIFRLPLGWPNRRLAFVFYKGREVRPIIDAKFTYPNGIKPLT